MRRVVGPVAVLRDGAGRLRYLYMGTVLPDGLNEDDIARLTRKGLVAEVEDPAPADPDEELDDDGDDDGEGDPADDEGGEPNPERPKLTASTQAWADFRRPKHGDAVDGLNRQALIDLAD